MFKVTIGVKELDTGLAQPNLWDLPADKQRMGEEHPLQVHDEINVGRPLYQNHSIRRRGRCKIFD